jgi:hypothetical protein
MEDEEERFISRRTPHAYQPSDQGAWTCFGGLGESEAPDMGRPPSAKMWGVSVLGKSTLWQRR